MQTLADLGARVRTIRLRSTGLFQSIRAELAADAREGAPDAPAAAEGAAPAATVSAPDAAPGAGRREARRSAPAEGGGADPEDHGAATGTCPLAPDARIIDLAADGAVARGGARPLRRVSAENGRAGGLEALPGAGPGLVWMLRECGVRDLGDLAAADPEDLRRRLGVIGALIDLAAWIDFARAQAAVPAR